MAEAKYKKILLKLSGEALSEGGEGIYNFDVLNGICSQIKTCTEMGVSVSVVVGAGNIWRGAKQGVKMERNRADHMGMLATVINCLAIANTLENLGVEAVVMTTAAMPTFAEPYNIVEAKKHLSKGRVVIFGCGTGSPFFSTDTGAVLKAAEVGVDAILFASPSDKSDSCTITGILRLLAAIVTGSPTYPPLEKTTLGFSLFKTFFASVIDFINLKGRLAFLVMLLLTSLTQGIL